MQPGFSKQCALQLFAAAVALLAVGCGDKRPDAAWWQGENERLALEHELNLKTFRFEQAYSNDFPELEAVRRSSASIAAALEQLRLRKGELSMAVASLDSQRDEFRRTVISQQRQRAIGAKFDEMTLASGRSFRTVSVSGIDDAGVTVRHEDGSAKLRFGDLDASQRQFFGLEKDLAMAAEGQEKQDAIAYERWVDSRLVAMQEDKLDQQKEAAKDRREEIALKRARASAAARNLVAANTSTLSRSSSSVGTRSWRYSSYRTYRPTYRSVCYSTPRYYCTPRVSIRKGRYVGSRNPVMPTVSPAKKFANTQSQ